MRAYQTQLKHLLITNRISIKKAKRGSQEWGDADVNRSDNICSNRISTNYYGSNGGIRK